MSITRRRFLVASASAAAGLSSGFALRPATLSAAAHRTLIFVQLRGGADGMSMLVPHGDPRYRHARRHTALAAPGGGPDAALDLDGYFGLHPRLAPLATWFARRELAAWPAVGWPSREYSHGLAERRLRHAVERQVGSGHMLRLTEQQPGAGRYPLSAQLAHVAQLIEYGAAPSVIWTETSGWDTHVAQGAAASGGRMADQLTDLTNTLCRFRARLEPYWHEVAVAVVTEFGRSPLENPQAGTDDGHASALLLMGGNIPGGRVFGAWPQLTHADAIAVTTDLSTLLPELIETHTSAASAGRRT